ncbi:MAG: HD domain-containing protein [Planctomycetes bacterium]|nr:HD domain-containing protein [Planctomycetota bacterium]
MIKKHINSVTPGMVLGKPIYGENYEILLKKGVELTQGYIERLKARGYACIYIEDKDTEDIVINDPISDKIRLMATKDILKTYKVTQASISDIEADTSESVMRSINTPKVKRTFQESQAFKQLVTDIDSFLDEIMGQDILSGLNSIKTVDNYTFEHSIDAAIISLIIAKKLYLDKKKLKQIAIGEFLHDIGKIFIDINLLNKPGKLTPEEFDKIKQHTSFGYELLKDIDAIGYVSAHIPYQHHERQDGKGYPRGLLGNNKIDKGEITYVEHDKMIMGAEIAAVADFYDACISDRPYRKGMTPDVVYDLIRNGAGTQFNKELVNCFLSVMPKYPVGSEVKVTQGMYKDFTGVVAFIDVSHMTRPRVKLLNDDKKNKIKPIEIDLSREASYEIQCI